jgi:hypothetical protein
LKKRRGFNPNGNSTSWKKRGPVPKLQQERKKQHEREGGEKKNSRGDLEGSGTSMPRAHVLIIRKKAHGFESFLEIRSNGTEDDVDDHVAGWGHTEDRLRVALVGFVAFPRSPPPPSYLVYFRVL